MLGHYLSILFVRMRKVDDDEICELGYLIHVGSEIKFSHIWDCVHRRFRDLNIDPDWCPIDFSFFDHGILTMNEMFAG